MPEFWADWRQQYGIFWLESQTLLSGEDTQGEVALYLATEYAVGFF